MLHDEKQTGCYLTEEQRMKWAAHGGTPLMERRSPSNMAVWCCGAVRRPGGYRETGVVGGEEALPPWTVDAKSNGRSWAGEDDFAHSEKACRFRRVACEETFIDLKRCTRLEMPSSDDFRCGRIGGRPRDAWQSPRPELEQANLG